MSKSRPVMSHDPLAELSAGDENPSVDAGSAMDPAAVLVLPSSLTIADVGQGYELFSGFAQAEGRLVIDGGELETVDGAGIQLIAALLKHVIAQARAVEWRATSGVLTEAMGTLGMGALLQVSSDPIRQA